MAKTNKAAGTALGPMIIAAAEQYLPANQRIVDDPEAASMLSGSGKIFANLCRWTPPRRMLFALSEAKGRGIWGSILSRKRFIDDEVADALVDGLSALVILGAGFDTRGLRFALPAGLPAYEIDLPGNIADKRATIERAKGQVPDGLHLLPVDFETADLDKTLAEAGFDPSRPALFVWEGVTQYLTEPAVRKTLDFLSHAARGSKLIFTYVLADFLAGKNMHDAAPIYRHLVERYKLWHFGLMPDDLGPLLAPYGWQVIRDAGAADYRRDYLEPAGRDLTLMEIERIAIAEKTA